MTREAEQEVSAAAEPSEYAIDLLENFCYGLRRSTLHAIHNVAMTAFLEVQLGSIRRQPIRVDLKVLVEECLDHP